MDYFLFPSLHVPRGVPLLLDGILTIVILGAVRASWRMFREHFWPVLSGKDCRWALLVGTDLSNGILAHQIQSHFQLALSHRGAPGHRRRKGDATGPNPHPRHAGRRPRDRRRVPRHRRAGGRRHASRAPPADPDGGLRAGRAEPEDHPLPGRPPRRRLASPSATSKSTTSCGATRCTLDTENIGKLLEGRRVMVTGAGGSIGSEICRQIMAFQPASR